MAKTEIPKFQYVQVKVASDLQIVKHPWDGKQQVAVVVQLAEKPIGFEDPYRQIVPMFLYGTTIPQQGRLVEALYDDEAESFYFEGEWWSLDDGISKDQIPRASNHFEDSPH